MSDRIVAALAQRNRAVLTTSLIGVTGLSWVYLLQGAGMGMHMAMPMVQWTLGYGAVVFVMWAVMMVAMMLPSAAPTILLVSALERQRVGHLTAGVAGGAAGLFATGYVLTWVGFSLAATVLQWALSRAGMISPMMAATNRTIAAALLIAAGIYQWTPFKDACLRHCRSPAAALVAHWRPGWAGALRGGMVSGLYCTGCCWALMVLLFVGGVMNFAWIIGLTLLVLVEKTLPGGGWTARASGVAFAGAGVTILVAMI